MSRAPVGVVLGLLGLLTTACRDDPGSDPRASSGASSTTAVSTTTDDTTDGTLGDDTLGDGTTAELREPAPLVDNAAWQVVEADDDPVPAHRPASVECGVAGAYMEDNSFEIDTTFCNYLARVQPSLVEVRAGDTIAVLAFHDTLASVEAGQAHFALLLGSTVVWQEFVPIPASPGIVDATPYQAQVIVDFDAPAGTPVGLHLHNHGYNTWTLLAAEVRPGP